MKSALFVDFDNVYLQLRQLQLEAAERFARHPSEWIGWLTGSLAMPEPHEEGEQRRLLVRRFRGMQMNGHVFGQGDDDESTLTTRLFDQILFLCEREQKMLDQTELSHIPAWIGAPAAA